MCDSYNSLKKGYKVEVTKEINRHVRNMLVEHNWDIDTDKIVYNVLKEVSSIYFIREEIYSIYNEDLINEFEEFLIKKIKVSIKEFENQDPTVNQIYRYVEACQKLGLKVYRYYTNKEIWLKTGELEMKINGNLQG